MQRAAWGRRYVEARDMQEQVTSLGASPRRNRPTGVELKVEGVGHLGVGWAWGVAGAAVNFDNLPNFGLYM